MNPETLDLLREALARDDCPEDLRGAFADLLMTGTIPPSHFGLRIPFDRDYGVWFYMYLSARKLADPYDRFGPHLYGPPVLSGHDEDVFAANLRTTLNLPQ